MYSVRRAMEPLKSGSPQANPLRILRPKMDKLACQTQGVSIFAKRNNP